MAVIGEARTANAVVPGSGTLPRAAGAAFVEGEV